MSFKIKWHDGGRAPRCPPDPAYPNGINLNIAQPGDRCCTVALPYPAKRCGHYKVECSACGFTLVVTTAGRPDDPRSVRIPCKEMRH